MKSPFALFFAGLLILVAVALVIQLAVSNKVPGINLHDSNVIVRNKLRWGLGTLLLLVLSLIAYHKIKRTGK